MWYFLNHPKMQQYDYVTIIYELTHKHGRH